MEQSSIHTNIVCIACVYGNSIVKRGVYRTIIPTLFSYLLSILLTLKLTTFLMLSIIKFFL